MRTCAEGVENFLMRKLWEIEIVRFSLKRNFFQHGYTDLEYKVGNTCYHVCNAYNGSWWEAELKCQKIGGHLLSINSYEEYNMIIQYPGMRELKYFHPNLPPLWIGHSIQKSRGFNLTLVRYGPHLLCSLV